MVYVSTHSIKPPYQTNHWLFWTEMKTIINFLMLFTPFIMALPQTELEPAGAKPIEIPFYICKIEIIDVNSLNNSY